MNKFDALLLLDAASLATEMTMVGQLEDMRKRGAAQAVMQKILAALRDWIFKYNEASKNILELEKKNPKQAAGAMQLLYHRLQNSGISPDWFFELGDKTYVADTFRSIRDNVDRLNQNLSESDKKEVQSFFDKAHRLDDYNYYIANHDALLQYRQASRKVNSLGSGGRTLGIVLVAIGCFCGGFSTFSSLAVYGGIEYSLAQVIVSVVLCGLLPFIPGVFLAYFGHEGATAKAKVNQITSTIDINEMNTLENEFNGNIEEVKRLRDEAQSAFDMFFGKQSLSMP